jgi:hypothetical protein
MAEVQRASGPPHRGAKALFTRLFPGLSVAPLGGRLRSRPNFAPGDQASRLHWQLLPFGTAAGEVAERQKLSSGQRRQRRNSSTSQPTLTTTKIKCERPHHRFETLNPLVVVQNLNRDPRPEFVVARLGNYKNCGNGTIGRIALFRPITNLAEHPSQQFRNIRTQILRSDQPGPGATCSSTPACFCR